MTVMVSRIDVLVIGGANFDYSITTSKLPKPGETVVGKFLLEAPGGKGANQAIAARRLGARVAFVGRVGADERGRQILAALEDEEIDTSRCAMDRSALTGVALIVVGPDGNKSIVTAPGANHRLTPDDIDHADALFDRTKVVLLQLEAGLLPALTAARRAQEAGALVVLDAAPPIAHIDELLECCDVVRANASEAKVLTGIEVTDVHGARKAAHALRGDGAAFVSTPTGDLLVFGDGQEAWYPRQHVDVVDATGAGDAFAAGIAVGLAEGRSLIEAGWLGCAAAALKTTRLGAQDGLPQRGEVDRFLSAVHR
jgi:ribokinase